MNSRSRFAAYGVRMKSWIFSLTVFVIAACSTTPIQRATSSNFLTGTEPEGFEYASMETVRLAKITNPEGKQYTMAVLGNKSLFDSFDYDFGKHPIYSTELYNSIITEPNFSILNAHLREAAMKWDIEQYKIAYPHIDPSVFDEMLTSDSGTDNRSALIVIFEGNDATKIVSTLRFAFPHPKKGTLPLDHLHGRRFSPKMVKKERPIVDRVKLDFNTGELTKDTVRGGMTGEIKNLVKDSSVGSEFTSLMFLAAEKYGLTNRFHTHQPDRLWKPDTMFLLFNYTGLIENYLIIANDRMKNFYQRLGFEVVEENIANTNDIVMKASRNKLVKALQKQWGMKGGRIIRGIEEGYVFEDYSRGFYERFERSGYYKEQLSEADPRLGLVITEANHKPETLLAHFNLTPSVDSCAHMLSNIFRIDL